MMITFMLHQQVFPTIKLDPFLDPKTMNDGTKYFAFKTFMVYQDTPLNVMMVFTDKVMSIAVPADEMITQYKNALGEMAAYLEEDEAQRLEDDFKDSLSLDEFLDEMDRNEEFMDSDISGMEQNYPIAFALGINELSF